MSIAALALGGSVFAANGAAQAKGSDSDNAIIVTGKAERKLDNLAYRVTLKTEWFGARDGDVFFQSSETFVSTPPDRYQTIVETGDTRVETIVVDGKSYRRTNDEDWVTVANPPIKRAGDPFSAVHFGQLAGGAKYPAGEGKFVSKGTIDGQEVSMYEVRKVLQDNTPDAQTRTETTRYWVNNSGLILRRIIEHEFVGDPRVMRSTANFAYTDVNIEVPNLPVSAQDK